MNKFKAIQSAFITQRITFNGKIMPNTLNTPIVTKTRVAIVKKLKISLKKNKKQKN